VSYHPLLKYLKEKIGQMELDDEVFQVNEESDINMNFDDNGI